MKHPQNIDRPFFAYGLFRPGQLAYFQIRYFVSRVLNPARTAGSLRLRDGLPIIAPLEHEFVDGALLTFRPKYAEEAYNRISAMEPDKHYLWRDCLVNDQPANVLIGRLPMRGSVSCEDKPWNGWNDPLFTAALDVVEESLQSEQFDWDFKALFRLQMAYLLLWSSIERYVSLRYHLGENVTEKVRHLANESAFADSLIRSVEGGRKVYRADRPGQRELLDPKSPDKALRYYYQVRCNITHRGKGAVGDYDMLKNSLKELLPIFRHVLQSAERDAAYSA